MRWYDTETIEEAAQLAQDRWRIVETSPGTFKVQPAPKRELSNYRRPLPEVGECPAQMRQEMEAAVEALPMSTGLTCNALRAIAREQRHEKRDYVPALAALHRFAAIFSFCIPYSEKLKQPGFNIFERIPFAELWSLELRWEVIGCDLLDGLTKTDRKWMREVWGEPLVHTTGPALFPHFWGAHEDRIFVEQELEREKSRAEFRKLLGKIK